MSSNINIVRMSALGKAQFLPRLEYKKESTLSDNVIIRCFSCSLNRGNFKKLQFQVIWRPFCISAAILDL